MNERKRRIAGAAVLALGVVFLLTGIDRSETQTVLRKAVTICLECIGIG